jgi:hypothetical protein
MVSIPGLIERVAAPGKRRPLAFGAAPVNVPEVERQQPVGEKRVDLQQPSDPIGATTMRAVLLVLILLVAAVLIAVGTGFLDINQIRGAKAPEITTTSNGVVAKGGQRPAFDVETGSLEVGSRNATVTVPTLEVKRPADQPAANEGQANNVNAM